MSTVIYPSPIFGPVISRRLGVSLGINLMPADGKICTFDCIYCECGLNAQRRPTMKRPSTDEVAKALEDKLKEMTAEGRLPDVLTFAGNGEPTVHPDFPAIIDAVTALRDRYCPQAKVSVLSNATRAGVPAVREALMKVDNNIQKLDTISPDYIRRINQPTGHYDVAEVIDHLKAFGGHVIIQTMFMTGRDLEGNDADNTADTYVTPWLEAVKAIKPEKVMIYTIDRETPDLNLRKASHEVLDAIARRVAEAGLEVSVSY